VVSFASADYLPLLANWLLALNAVGVGRLRVYALDDLTAECADRWGVEISRLHWDGTLPTLWRDRLTVLQALLDEGTTFVHSDLDAVWLQDPFTRPDLGQGSDLVFSQGTTWPNDVHEEHGFVVCCGWFLARPTHETKQFLAEVQDDVTRSGDDQMSVNRLLSARNIVWEGARRPDYRLAVRGGEIDCWTTPMVGRSADRDLTVELLPHHQFQRVPESGPAIVKHLLSSKTVEDKIALLAQHDLLFLATTDVHDIARRPLEELGRRPNSGAG